MLLMMIVYIYILSPGSMKLVILMLACLGIAFSSVIALSGSFEPYTDYDNPNFQQIVAFVKVNHAELFNLNPSTVKRQAVNGFNYQITFQPSNNCSISTTIHVSLESILSETQYQSTPFNCEKLQNMADTAILTQPAHLLAGGEQNIDNFQSQEFLVILAFIIKNNPYLQKIAPSKVQTQIVAGKNYKVTFKISDNCSVVIKVYRNIEQSLAETQNYALPDNCNAEIKTIRTIIHDDHHHMTVQAPKMAQNSIVIQQKANMVLTKSNNAEQVMAGGYSSSLDTNSASFQKILSFIYANHLQLVGVPPKKVATQLVSGLNYKVLFEINRNCSLEIVIYQNIQGDLSETSYQPMPQTCTTLIAPKSKVQDQVTPSSIKFVPPLPLQQPSCFFYREYKPYNDTNSQQFKKLLASIREDNNLLLNIEPNQVNRQVLDTSIDYMVTFPLEDNCSVIAIKYGIPVQNLSDFDYEYSPFNCQLGKFQENPVQIPMFNVGIMGGQYQQFQSLNSSSFKTILSFINGLIPEISQTSPKSAQMQIVNGFNYKINYSIQDYYIILTVYSTFQDDLSLISYESNSSTPGPKNIKNAYQSAIKLHPFLQFYRLKFYKLVYSDSMLELSFVGYDNYTVIDLILDSKAEKSIKQVSLKISCASDASICNPSMAENVYKANQYLIKQYSNLKNFTMTTFKATTTKSSNTQIIYQIFTNPFSNQKTLANLMISQKGYKVLLVSAMKS